MADKIQLRRDLAANWTSNNPVLAQGEEGYELDTGRRKVGDGATAWTGLPYSGNTDHGLLGGLGDDDHPQYHNDTRGDARYYTQAQVDAQQLAQDNAIALKYDASNPNGYETPAQLSARDMANRNRANHTGTQTAATISDFVTAVQSAETNTTLQNIGNLLRYTNEDGVQFDIDLTPYLDDTNLARIVSGVVLQVGPDWVMRITRDDSSTFDINVNDLRDGISDHGTLGGLTDDDHPQYHNDARGDARYYTQSQVDAQQLAQDTNIGNNATNISSNTSAISANSGAISTLQSEQATQDAAIALNTAKVSADGPVSTHSDVDLTGIQTGDSVEWDGLKLVPRAILNGFTVFPIWAEENGGLDNNAFEWSYGNGATGASIGVPLGTDCELFALSFNAETFGTSVSFNLQKNQTTEATVNFVANNTALLLPTPVPFALGDLYGVQTNTVNGGMTDARVIAWFRQKATAIFPTPDNQVVNGAAPGFASGTFATVPGMTTNVVLTDTGKIKATATYSAVRAGGTNAVSEFRVVINGDNGLSFPETLSTFNDTGAISHSVTGLAAGTYSVSVEAQTTQPINIAAIQLDATATED